MKSDTDLLFALISMVFRIKPTRDTRQHFLANKVSYRPFHQIFELFKTWHYGNTLISTGKLKAAESIMPGPNLEESCQGSLQREVPSQALTLNLIWPCFRLQALPAHKHSGKNASFFVIFGWIFSLIDCFRLRIYFLYW